MAGLDGNVSARSAGGAVTLTGSDNVGRLQVRSHLHEYRFACVHSTAVHKSFLQEHTLPIRGTCLVWNLVHTM